MNQFGKKVIDLVELSASLTNADTFFISHFNGTGYDSYKVSLSTLSNYLSAGGGSNIASDIIYSNIGTNLSGTNVQAVITEINTKNNTISGDIFVLNNEVDLLTLLVNAGYTAYRNTSGKYESVYSNVNSNSSNWNLITTAYSTTNSNSANWNNVLSTVQTNSAGWALSGSTISLPQSANWNSTYTTVNANSAMWALSGSSSIDESQLLTYMIALG